MAARLGRTYRPVRYHRRGVASPAARRPGRNPETVRRWIRQGKLRSERIGTQHLIREDLEAILPEPPLDPAWKTPDEGPMPPRESH